MLARPGNVVTLTWHGMAIPPIGAVHRLHVQAQLRTYLQHWRGLLEVWAVEVFLTTSSVATSLILQSLLPVKERQLSGMVTAAEHRL